MPQRSADASMIICVVTCEDLKRYVGEGRSEGIEVGYYRDALHEKKTFVRNIMLRDILNYRVSFLDAFVLLFYIRCKQ